MDDPHGRVYMDVAARARGLSAGFLSSSQPSRQRVASDSSRVGVAPRVAPRVASLVNSRICHRECSE